MGYVGHAHVQVHGLLVGWRLLLSKTSVMHYLVQSMPCCVHLQPVSHGIDLQSNVSSSNDLFWYSLSSIWFWKCWEFCMVDWVTEKPLLCLSELMLYTCKCPTNFSNLNKYLMMEWVSSGLENLDVNYTSNCQLIDWQAFLDILCCDSTHWHAWSGTAHYGQPQPLLTAQCIARHVHTTCNHDW